MADKGALAEGAGPCPLLDDGFTDVFRGVPFGRTLKRDPMTAPLMERNSLIGGMPGQGKSSGARVIMTGAALDPTAEPRIAVPDTNFDFEALKPRCSVYIMGAETERIEEIRDELRRLHQEVQERGELLVRYRVPATSPATAPTAPPTSSGTTSPTTRCSARARTGAGTGQPNSSPARTAELRS